MPASTRRRGLLYDDAARFARDLEAKDHAASLQMLAAWSESYWGARQRLDTFLAKVEAARAAGEAPGVSWAYQERRLRNVLDSTATEMARYAQAASSITETRQRQAIQEGLEHAESLTTTVVAEGLPGLTGELARTNPDVLNQAVGFLQDGSVLREHLAATMPGDAADAVKSALVKGLAGGKSVDWMTREATRALGLSHGRAVTIMRTESLRAYRSASQAVYQANADVVGTWTWNAHLDARTCVACTLMDGTEHPLSATLDGHPRCRCAMVPRTRSWADLGVEGLDDTRPPVRQGREWLEDQSPEVQKAILGKAKFQAWQDGTISLDDMVARHDDPRWGTMRTERSLKAIQENRNANWMDDPGPQDLAKPPRPATTWDDWEKGRDVRVRKSTSYDRQRLTSAEQNVTQAQEWVDRDQADLDMWEDRVKARQAELRGYVPDAKERAKVSRTDGTLLNAKREAAYMKGRVDAAKAELAAAQERLTQTVVEADNLPDWNPDNPLEFYGDRVTIYDRSDTTRTHLQDLSEHVSEGHHHLLRGHYAESPDGGFYIGDRFVPDLDDLGHLRTEQPRGWREGASFNEVAGVYDPARRVCACGTDRHGSSSLVLHEGGHALDAAYGSQRVNGSMSLASERPEFLEAYNLVSADVRARWNPYYRPEGNPNGWASEAWAEGFAAWTKARNGTLEEQAKALAEALVAPDPAQSTIQAHMGLAAYYRSLT